MDATVSSAALYRLLPAVDSLLQQPVLARLCEQAGSRSVKAAINARLANIRQQIAGGDSRSRAQLQHRLGAADFSARLAGEIAASLEQQLAGTLVPVFNLTGTVIHTNLGRARLPMAAVEAMQTVARESNNLEFDLDSGGRGERDQHLQAAIRELTGAEAATVVNNNAAAVLLVLNTFALGKTVLISRGELVEIGGSFRIPDIMQSAGCRLQEVGTTNRTHLHDFAAAINAQTGLIMKVHTSNYQISGFTAAVPAPQLRKLAQQYGLPLVSDLGSGTLVRLGQFGLPDEPTVSRELEQGADLVTFSGDKLLGGPQAGLIVGRAELIDQLRKNPLKRALRVDKITLAALLAVFRLYRNPQQLPRNLPVLSDLTRPVTDIKAVADQLLDGVRQALAGLAEVTIEACKSQIGSGALPVNLLDSYALVCTPIAARGQRDATLLQLAAALRQLPKPIIGRVHGGRLWLDCRCLRDDVGFLAQLEQLAGVSLLHSTATEGAGH